MWGAESALPPLPWLLLQETQASLTTGGDPEICSHSAVLETWSLGVEGTDTHDHML